MSAAGSSLPARSFCFEIAAILASSGFDQICPALRQRTLNYVYNPAVLFLALNKFASNLNRDIYEFVT
jgi:hypothetical protein